MFNPKYSISNKILKNIGQIEAAREVIENSPVIPSFEKQFQTDAIIRTVHHGTHIEGNDLTLEQTKKILEGAEVYGRPRDVQEVINYRNTIRILDDFKSEEKYSEDQLKKIHATTVHKIVAEEKIGVFRQTQVVIKEENTGQVIFSPPPHVEVRFLIEDFFIWLNSDESKSIHPVLRAGIAHYIIVAIHPFVEGNGRSTRAFADLILLKEGYETKRFFAFEEHFDTDLTDYYEAFAKVNKQSPKIGNRDLTSWLEYFTEVVAVELQKIKQKIRKISIDTRLKVQMGEQVALTERQMRLIEYITDQGSAPMRDLRSVIPMVSEDTILRDLTDLISKGLVQKQGKTKASRYIITNRNV